MARTLKSRFSRKNMPVQIREAFEAHDLFKAVWEGQGFTPSPDADIRAFIGFAHDKGGFDALDWLLEHEFITDDQVIEWELSQEVTA